jgi:hypothetical protein
MHIALAMLQLRSSASSCSSALQRLHKRQDLSGQLLLLLLL